MNPFLSIAIPTYGAPNSVKKTVDTLIKWDIENIEIVVMDNDETGLQIKDYMTSINDKRFTYIQNERNIGRNNNIAKVIEISKANHVLLMSSDDTIYYDAVEEIMELIKKNPSLGLIMGYVKTTEGKNGFVSPKPGIYSAGADALMNVPFLGNLMPMVVNKRYLDFKDLYNQKEFYMQTRLALIEACRADFLFLECTIGEMISNETYAIDIDKLEILKNGYSPEKWDMDLSGEKYYSPQARVKQLKQYLDLIEKNSVLRLNRKLDIIHKWVTNKLADSLYAVIAYKSNFFISTDGYMGHLNYETVIDYFEREMSVYFVQKEYENKYFFMGRLRDIIKNEMLLIKQGKEILEHILKARYIGIYGAGRQEHLLKNLLECFEIHSEIFTDDAKRNFDLVLVPTMYSANLDEKLKSIEDICVDFMDRMGKYIGIAWCSEHDGKEYWQNYNAYID